MSDPALLAELDCLRASTEALRIQFRLLSERVGHLEEGPAVSSGSLLQVPSSAASAPSEGYSLVSRASSRGPVVASDTQGREQLAGEIGQFIIRALNGNHRGTSGRDRLKLGSEVYLLFADYPGNPIDPPRLVQSFGEVARVCKRGNCAGSAVFVGLPTEWEAQIVVEQAGFSWPVNN